MMLKLRVVTVLFRVFLPSPSTVTTYVWPGGCCQAATVTVTVTRKSEIKKGEITRYEKAKKKRDIEEKFAMIQEEIKKKNAPEPEPASVPEPEPEPVPEPEPESEPKPKIQKKKTREIIEVVEEDEDEDDEEEEVVVKRIIKRKPIAKKHYQDEEDMIQKTNIELLKNKLKNNFGALGFVLCG